MQFHQAIELTKFHEGRTIIGETDTALVIIDLQSKTSVYKVAIIGPERTDTFTAQTEDELQKTLQKHGISENINWKSVTGKEAYEKRQEQRNKHFWFRTFGGG